MDANQTCDLILIYIKKSNLNWNIRESPFSLWRNPSLITNVVHFVNQDWNPQFSPASRASLPLSWISPVNVCPPAWSNRPWSISTPPISPSSPSYISRPWGTPSQPIAPSHCLTTTQPRTPFLPSCSSRPWGTPLPPATSSWPWRTPTPKKAYSPLACRSNLCSCWNFWETKEDLLTPVT